MNHYAVLGLEPGATAEEIKRAYRQLAMKHHPDRGGDVKRFQDINHAYQALQHPSEPQPHTHSQDPFESFHDHLFRQFGWGQQARVWSLAITLEECWHGCEYQVNNRVIRLPPGVRNGTTVTLSPGEQVVVQIKNHPLYRRNQDDLLRSIQITISEAIMGTQVVLEHLSGQRLAAKIPPGIQPNQVIKLAGQGLPNPQWPNQRGHLFCQVGIRIPHPSELTPEQTSAILSMKTNQGSASES
jgi:DnaJ-class molecular chaperone